MGRVTRYTRTGDAAWGTPSRASARMGENAAAGPVRNIGKTCPEHDSAGPVRGYIKLSDAAKAFRYDFRGKTVLDIGSSTGGFTEYALDHGATKVIAVEKGTNQMKSPLRFNPRIELHEKTDIFDFELSNEINTIVADVSFISLKPILKYTKRKNIDYLVMLKPQFEAKPNELNKGVVKNNKIRRDIIKNFEQWLKDNDFIIINKHDNDLKGKTGNEERFYLLKTLAN